MTISKPKISASSLWRAAACPGSTVLKKIPSAPEEPAIVGTAIHKFLDDVVKLGYDAALKAVPDKYRDKCTEIDVSLLPFSGDGEIHTEVSFAYNWKTGVSRVLGKSLDREYVIEDDEIAGTADVVVLYGDKVIVYDYKTGRGFVEDSDTNWQLKFLGLAAAKAYKKPAASVGIIWIYQDDPSSVGEDGKYKSREAEFDEFDLDMIHASLTKVMARAYEAASDKDNGDTPELRIGSHCRYCAASIGCPAKQSLIRSALSDPKSLISDANEPSLAQEGVLYTMIKVAEDALTELKEVIKDRARTRPLPLPSGKYLSEVESSRESIVGNVAEKVLREMYGEEGADLACTREVKTSKAQIERMIKTRGKERGATKVQMERVLAEIRKNGGGSKKFFYQVTEVSKDEVKLYPDGSPSREIEPTES